MNYSNLRQTMYRMDRNNFYQKPKKSTIYTPEYVSNYLYDILHKTIPQGYIFDPCVGKGSLLKPWEKNNWEVKGGDIENQGFPKTIVKNYLKLSLEEDLNDTKPSLVIFNPPFNISSETKEYIKHNCSGRPLLPEVWLENTIKLFGNDIPIVMFTPYGFRLNLTMTSKRWKKLINKTYPEITSIISLPKNVFENIIFHAEILVFNIKNIKPHYFLLSK